MDAVRGCGAGSGFGGYTAESGGCEEVGGADQIVGVVLEGVRLGSSYGRRGGTMSSGSSGKSVMVPEPSRSMFCLIRRMVRGL